MNNPFLIVGYQGPEYFCDREKETEVILSALHNGREKYHVGKPDNLSQSTLKEIFDYLRQSGRECYLAIDEFQQIMEYPEKGLRSFLILS